MIEKWFFIILFLIIAIQRASETFATRKKKIGIIKQKWTFSLLFVGHFIVVIGALEEYLLLQRDINFVITFLGFILYVSGLIGRKWSIRSLGEYWSIHLEIRKDHKLTRKGPYKYIRHPAYLSMIFEVCGIPLIVNAYFIFLFSIVVYIPILLLRVYYEEKEHFKIFGEKYLTYKKKVGAFSPRIRKAK